MLEKWKNVIKSRGGKYKGSSWRISPEETELFISGEWIDNTKENKNRQKDMRDLTAKELRESKYQVRTRSNSWSYYVDAIFIIKHDEWDVMRYKKMQKLQEDKFKEFMGLKI